MQNTGLDDLPDRIKIGRINVNNFRYEDDTVVAENKEN